AALADEVTAIKTAAPGAVHVTAEPVQTLDAGWDVAAIGEGETTLLRLVDAAGVHEGVPGLPLLRRLGREDRPPRTTPAGLVPRLLPALAPLQHPGDHPRL